MNPIEDAGGRAASVSAPCELAFSFRSPLLTLFGFMRSSKIATRRRSTSGAPRIVPLSAEGLGTNAI
jgi:hypothetical protein